MSKFDILVESAMRRYQGTDLLVGDRVKFIEAYLQHEWIKKQASMKLERLRDLIESGEKMNKAVNNYNKLKTNIELEESANYIHRDWKCCFPSRPQ